MARRYSERTIPGINYVPLFGLNYHMSEIQATLGRQWLVRVREILERRRANFDS